MQRFVILAMFCTDIIKVDFFARSKLNFSNFAQEKEENITKNHLTCVKNEEKTVKTRLK